jgi:hypothetical protein
MSTLTLSRRKLTDSIMLQMIPKTTPRRPLLCPLGSLQKITSHQRYVEPNSILTDSNHRHCISSPTLKLSSGSQRSPLHPTSQKLALPSAILICQREPSNTGKHSTFQRGTSILALSKIHGHSVICSQKHSVFGIRCFPTTPRCLPEQENQSST